MTVPEFLLVTFVVSEDGYPLGPLDTIVAKVPLAHDTSEPDYDGLLEKVNDAVIAKIDSLA